MIQITKAHVREYLLQRRRITRDGCWEIANRIGVRSMIAIHHRRYLAYHWAAWAWLEFDLRRISPTYQINHTCDNSKCWRPSHLTIGSQSANMVEAYRRNKAMVAKTKLDEEKVGRIICLLEQKVPQAQIINSLSSEWGVSRGAIWSVIKGRNWAWLSGLPKR